MEIPKSFKRAFLPVAGGLSIIVNTACASSTDTDWYLFHCSPNNEHKMVPTFSTKHLNVQTGGRDRAVVLTFRDYDLDTGRLKVDRPFRGNIDVSFSASVPTTEGSIDLISGHSVEAALWIVDRGAETLDNAVLLSRSEAIIKDC